MSPRAETPSPYTGISAAELQVLKALWELGASSPTVLRERLAADGTDWAYTTVQTLLHRLLDKGCVTRRREGVAQLYEAGVSQDELVVRQMQELAERVAEGSASSLIRCFVRGKGLSKRELARLRALLDEAERS